MTHTQEFTHHSCDACRIIDEADGTVDGKMFKLDHWGVSNERLHFKRFYTAQDKAADRVTKFAGSLNFVYLHSVWFVVWIAINVGLVGASAKFDKFPFGLLTMIVSLEAIFLSTFVMVSQNRQAARSETRSQVDFESNLQSLIWSVHIAHKLGLMCNMLKHSALKSLASRERSVTELTSAVHTAHNSFLPGS